MTALAIRTVKVDISHLLGASDSNEPPPTRPATTSPASLPPITTTEGATSHPAAQASGSGGKRSMPAHPSETPAKKQSKWSQEEDALIIDLRGGGMKWEDISKRLPGRSAISCRLHYQNYLERRSEWDEERKNKLARLYERYVYSPGSLWVPPNRHNCEMDFYSSVHSLIILRVGLNQKCGPRLQKKWVFHGGQRRPCTGSWERPTWHVGQAWSHSLFQAPPSMLPLMDTQGHYHHAATRTHSLSRPQLHLR